MPAVTYKLEVEFVPGSGTYIDLSSRLERIVIARPRPGTGQGGLASTFDATLQNDPIRSSEVGTGGVTTAHVGFCPFSPDSPASPWWPNVTRDRRVRVTALWNAGANSKVRFFGWSTVWTPEAGDQPPGSAIVTLSGADVLSKYAQRRVLSYYGETVISLANYDYYPFNEPADSQSVLGYSGDPVAFPPASGLVVNPSTNPGSLAFNAPDGGHLMDGQAEFTRGDSVSAPAPVILIRCRPGQSLSLVSASFRLATDPVGSTGDEALAGYDLDGNLLWLWSAVLSGGKVVWQLRDASGTARSFWDTGAPRDDAWHFWTLKFNSATASTIVLVEKGGLVQNLGSSAWGNDPRPTAWIVVGGQMVPARRGKQSNTLQGAVSSLALAYASGSTFSLGEFCVPGVTSNADRVAQFLADQGAALSILSGGSVTPALGSDSRQVLYTNATGDLLSRWNEHVQTVGGGLIVRPAGQREYLTAAGMRLSTVALTLNAEQDLSAPDGGWGGPKEERPTRITVTSPLGAFLVIDEASETASGLRLEGSGVQTAAGSEGVARSVAALLMSGGQARLQFGMDLTTTSTDKITATMDLKQTQRIRITTLPSALLGLVQQDVYASGWNETWEAEDQSCRFQFDTDPADDDPEAVFDDAEYGRYGLGNVAGVLATVTGGTCVGTTATGTVIITAAAGAGVLTTTGGSYSLDLDWNGERITVSGVGGGTSPQTATITVRGVAPTVARVHVAGESVDVWRSWTWSP